MNFSTLRRNLVVIFVFIALLIAVVPVGATPPANEVEGVFTTQIFTDETCTSPVGFCSVGTVTGDIEGAVDVALTAANFTEIDGIPTLVYATNITITSNNGTISGVSNGTINLITNELNAVFELNSGTGFYTNRRGVLTVSGTSNPATGLEVLPFTGTLSVMPPGQS